MSLGLAHWKIGMLSGNVNAPLIELDLRIDTLDAD